MAVAALAALVVMAHDADTVSHEGRMTLVPVRAAGLFGARCLTGRWLRFHMAGPDRGNRLNGAQGLVFA